jgi:hypothetical protein
MKIYVKVHQACKDIIVAACDEDVLGKTFREGELCLTVNPGFYKGSLREVDDLGKLLPSATIVNLVGASCVEKAIQCGVIRRDNVLEIGGTLHAQMVVV